MLTIEKQPISGQIIRAFHDRYIAQRAKIGPPTQSASDPILRPLEERGILGGFNEAINQTVIVFEFERYEGWEQSFAIAVALSIASAEFFLISSGIPINSKDLDNGNWKAFSKYVDRQ